MSAFTRRSLLQAAAFAGAGELPASAPAPPVAVETCRTYDPKLLVATLRQMFDRLGGLAPIVRGKTVAIKVNMTSTPGYRNGHFPLEMTGWTHPAVICAAIHLMEQAGARRFRILESPWKSAEPIPDVMLQAGWEPNEFLTAARRVEFENTNYLGLGKHYHRLKVPHGGLLFPAFDLNHSFADCDAFVSIAKMKEHATAGVTLAMKNCFGNTPCTIYGDHAGEEEPSRVPKGGRGPIHHGDRQPSASSPPEVNPDSPREGGYRVPRCIVDLIAARPVDLSIIDGVHAQAFNLGTNGLPVSPGLLVAGTNPVSTDAVGTALMGLDPMADRGQPPFEYCDSHLKLAEEVGLGSRDLSRIEVVGPPIREVACDYRAEWRKHGIGPRRPPRPGRR